MRKVRLSSGGSATLRRAWPPPDRDTAEPRGPREPATIHRSDRIHWMDRAHRGSADRSGMPNTCPAPAAGGAQHSCRPSREGAPNALRTPEIHRSGEPRASRLPSGKRCRGRRAGPLDTGIPGPVPDVDFTVRSAAFAREFPDSHDVPADVRELAANAIAMHHTPGVGLESGAEAYLLSA